MKGFGESSYLHKAHRFKDFAQNVIDTLHCLKIKKAILVGWSFGGTICQKVCEIAP
jgi:pimeloyl-ACP methyl ester carboxylesterase